MSYLLLLLLALAVMHAVYELILAPSFLDKYRFQLFELRDELRRMKCEHRDAFDSRVYHELQDALNIFVRFADRFDFYAIVRSEAAIKADPELKARLEYRMALIENCRLPDVRRMRSKINWVGTRLAMVNSGAWYLYLFPIPVWYHCKRFVKARIMSLMMLTEPEFEIVVPRARPLRVAATAGS